jgi:branched-chain amino acid transport system substrate-binding protein
MRMKKPFLLLVVILILVSSFAINTGTSSTQQNDVIKIGAIGPLAITPGKDMEDGAKLAVKEINEGGGVDVGGTAHDFELYIETTSGTTGIPEASVASDSMVQLLDQDEVVALIGGFRTEVVVAAIQPQLDRPFLGVGSTAPLITPYFWRVGPSNGSELSRALIDFYGFGLSAKGVKNITIVREQAAWSLAMSGGIKYYLNYYLPTVASLTPMINFTDDIVIAQDATLDSVTTTLAALSEDTYDGLQVNAIMTIFSGPAGRHISQAWHTNDLSQMLAGINVESQSSTFFDETEGACYGEIELETCPPDINQTTKTGPFRDAYFAEYGELPTYTAFASYDAIYVLKDAIERADSTDAADLQAALATTDYLGAAYRIKFTSEDNVFHHPLFGYPYGQVGYYDNGSRYVLVPGAEDVIVHDLYTPSTVGVRGQPYIQGYFAQWQQGGVKRTVWGNGSSPFTENLTKTMEWPIDHSEHGWVPEPTPTSEETSATVAETSETSAQSEVTEVPGFGLPLALLVLTVGSVVLSRLRKKKR